MKTAALAVALLCAAGCGTPAETGLKYTIRMEAKPGAVPATPVDPALSLIGSQVLEMMVPGGSLVISVITGQRGTRLGITKAHDGLPPGAMVLQTADGSIFGIESSSRTYWKIPPADAGGIQASTQRTGAFSILNGERVERVTFRLDSPAGNAAAGAPPKIVIEGEAWIAERFKKYTGTKGAAVPGGLALFQLADLGLSMRQILRSPMFAGQEIEATVISVAEENLPASFFEIPAGYTEVAMPGASGS